MDGMERTSEVIHYNGIVVTDMVQADRSSGCRLPAAGKSGQTYYEKEKNCGA